MGCRVAGTYSFTLPRRRLSISSSALRFAAAVTDHVGLAAEVVEVEVVSIWEPPEDVSVSYWRRFGGAVPDTDTSLWSVHWLATTGMIQGGAQ